MSSRIDSAFDYGHLKHLISGPSASSITSSANWPAFKEAWEALSSKIGDKHKVAFQADLYKNKRFQKWLGGICAAWEAV